MWASNYCKEARRCRLKKALILTSPLPRASRTHIGVVFGGPSPEHQVSVATAVRTMDYLHGKRFHCVPLYLAPDNTLLTGSLLRTWTNYPFSSPYRGLQRLEIKRASSGRVRLIVGERTVRVDIWLSALHGPRSEDGTIQGFLEFLDRPYVGPGLLASAVGMDKHATKLLTRALGIPSNPHVSLPVSADSKRFRKAVGGLGGYPIVAKPRRLGSSIGINHVQNDNQLRAAIKNVSAWDRDVILEPFLDSIQELECCVMRLNGRVVTSAIELEPTKSGELYSTDLKYYDDAAAGRRSYNPSWLSSNETEQIRDWSKLLYTELDCSGMIRADYFYAASATDGTKILFNEINTCPGLLGQFLWEASPHRSFEKILYALVEDAAAEWRARRVVQHRRMLNVFKKMTVPTRSEAP